MKTNIWGTFHTSFQPHKITMKIGIPYNPTGFGQNLTEKTLWNCFCQQVLIANTWMGHDMTSGGFPQMYNYFLKIMKSRLTPLEVSATRRTSSVGRWELTFGTPSSRDINTYIAASCAGAKFPRGPPCASWFNFCINLLIFCKLMFFNLYRYPR